MPAATAPDERMAMGVPIDGRRLYGCNDLVPGLEPAAFESERAYDLPPGLDQVQIGRVFGLEDKLPARMGQRKEQDIQSPMRTQVVQDGIDSLHPRIDPALHLLQEGDKVGR